MAERVAMSRLVRGKAPGREFDTEFWQKLGPTRIFEAAWDLVVIAAAVRGMKVNSDVRDLLRSLNAAGVEYLVVGGYAVYTKYLWIRPEVENARSLRAALSKFGAPVGEVTPEDFTQPETFFEIGVDPAVGLHLLA